MLESYKTLTSAKAAIARARMRTIRHVFLKTRYRKLQLQTPCGRQYRRWGGVVGPAKFNLRSELSRGRGLSANENQPFESGCGEQALA
jgi:hypothetical protein